MSNQTSLSLRGHIRFPLWPGLILFSLLALLPRSAAAESSAQFETNTLVLTVEGKVEVLAVGKADWTAALTNQVLAVGDQIRTGFRSRATLRLSDLTTLRMNQLTTLQIQPPAIAGKKPALDLKSGASCFLGRDKPTENEIRTPQTSGAILGTEFALEVTDDGRTVLTLIDGLVELTNAAGALQLTSGEQATVRAGQKPEKTAVIQAINIIQWALYYPAVLDPEELDLDAAEQQALAASLEAYRAGDLLGAVARYPAGREPASDGERVYLASLVLAVGQVTEAEQLLNKVGASSARAPKLAAALKR